MMWYLVRNFLSKDSRKKLFTLYLKLFFRFEIFKIKIYNNKKKRIAQGKGLWSVGAEKAQEVQAVALKGCSSGSG